MIEIEPPKENGEQETGKQDKLLTTTFQMDIENCKVEGLITYTTEQQIFKLKVNSGSSQELWGVNNEFTLYELKWTINAILQHMGFCHTTENPCVMMRVNHKAKSCEYIIIHQDESYIASNTLQEIIHIVKEKYQIKINPHVYQGSNFRYDPGGTLICSRQYMEIHNKILTLYIKFHQSKHYIHLNIPICKKQEKLIHEFILYTQEASYT